MKRSKRLMTLVVILAVICTATLMLSMYEEKQEEIRNSDEVILEIGKESVDAVSWSFSDTDLAFHKGEEGWLYDNDESFPVDEKKIHSILSHFESFGVSFVIENVEDYGQYGLENPEGIIRIETEDQTYELKLGDYSTMDEQRYVEIGDGNVYLISEDPADYMDTALSDMILHDEIPDYEKVVEIQFAGKEEYEITYTDDTSYSYSEEDIYFTVRNGKKVPLDPNTVTTYLDTMESLSFSDFVTYHATEEELKGFGLEEPELSVTVCYTYQDEEEQEVSGTYVLHIGQNQEELEEAKAAEEREEEEIPKVTKYVRFGDSPIVYELDDTSYEILAAVSYEDMCHKEVFWADSSLMTQIDITLEGENHLLTSKLEEGGEEEETRTWYYGEEEIELADFRTDLKSLSADSFTDINVEQKEEIGLTVYMDHELFPKIEIKLYRYDGTLCLAVVDGKTVSFVERSSVMELVEAVQTIVLKK